MYPVSALYIDAKGVYASLAADTWDAARDARLYTGSLPVVAHPPCGPWGAFRWACKKQHERDLAPLAVDQVRRWGGVLEHPAHSLLWKHCNLPLPGQPADAHGGRTYELFQGDFGFPAPKRTWLYAVRLPALALPPPVGNAPKRVEFMDKRNRAITPGPLAVILCMWASQAAPV